MKKYPLTAGYIAINNAGLIPSVIPRGISVRTVAAWLYRRIDNTNNASANNHGADVTRLEIELLMNSELPLKKVSPIHAIPKMATTAEVPALNTLPETILSTFGLHSRMIEAAMESITISIATGIDILV